jgi:hypothetical protein
MFTLSFVAFISPPLKLIKTHDLDNLIPALPDYFELS